MREHTLCSDLSIHINDAENGKYILSSDINKILERKKIHPKGVLLKDISTSKIEEELIKHPLVDEVQCYKTPMNTIAINISQRIPFMKIYPNKGNIYYIDNKGEIMPKGTRSLQPILIASGNIDKEYATTQLFSFGKALEKNVFWENQIQQIFVNSPKEVELIPRVGKHTILMGTLNNPDKKLNRLKKFYAQVLNKIGWDHYSKINVELNNQIICTKN